MAKIKDIKARQILDSRGNPTIEVDIFTDNGLSRAAVPSGASTGIYEALELRDNNLKKFNGKGVEKAIANISLILKEIKGMDCEQQREIDKKMIDIDGTEDKSKLGANAILAVSLAVARVGAKSKDKQLYEHLAELARNKELKLPIPAFNVINGGAHAGNELEFQEFMIMPVGAKTFSEALKIGAEIYHHLKQIIKSKHGKDSINVGDEGGFAPPLKKPEEALDLII
ncbi:MAG: phosphopyruvate hydratase, partial [Nanoarchaeota archaeon]|nr:phosphopyruvate hydratase [Nanoarchaeota archaeon]